MHGLLPRDPYISRRQTWIIAPAAPRCGPSIPNIAVNAIRRRLDPIGGGFVGSIATVYLRRMSKLDLKPRLSKDGLLQVTPRGWRLSIRPGGIGSYRLSQLDDQTGRARSAYPWQPPLKVTLRARVSEESMPGTWGFGLWNDPYGFSFGPGESFPRLPALPQAAWFFAASPRCYLSFRDDKPARGFYAQVFSSPGFRVRLLQALVTLPVAPKRARRILASIIAEDGRDIPNDPCEWHAYSIEWNTEQCAFSVDQGQVMQTLLSPRPPLGFVVWIDNQFAAFDPRGRIAWGVEANPSEQWLEVEDLKLER